MSINSFSDDIQHFTGIFHIKETCLDEKGYAFSGEKDIHFTAGNESDLLFAMPTNSIKNLNAFVDRDSIFIPLQWWDNYDDTQASFAGKGKIVNDSIFLHYGAGGAFGVVDCDCKGEKIKKQAEEYRGKLVGKPNPCTTIPCLPGIVWALETVENSYILSADNHWYRDNLVFDNTEYSREDSVVISGTAYHKYDINNKAYIELKIEKIALAGQTTSDSKVWHTDSDDPRPQSIFVDEKKILHISNAKNTLLSIHDTHGRKLQTLYPDSDNYETDISVLPPGLYIMGSMNIHIKFLIK
ncbi:MAG: T9SS type A sorting domain-containing protein [Tannerella sp.]|jgi:hypothetical protein|nr:T9SS type A sorting domain-containing protein [Tannerella sp.]